MKRYILLAAILLINIATMAQSYLGSTLTSVKKSLNDKEIDFEEQTLKNGKTTIKYFTTEGRRIYGFNLDDICEDYFVMFEDPLLIKQFSQQLKQLGYVDRKIRGADKNDYFLYQKGSYRAYCAWHEERQVIVLHVAKDLL